MQQLAQLLAALAVSDVGDDDHDDVVTADPSPDRRQVSTVKASYTDRLAVRVRVDAT